MGGFLTGVDPGIRKTKTPTVNTFVAGVGFTAGSSTTISLTDDPGTEEHLTIFFDGVGQHRSTYSVSGSTVTFDTAIPTGVAEIEATYAPAVYAQLSSVGTNAVTTTKILDGAVTAAKLASGAVDAASSTDMRLAFLGIAENAGDRFNMEDGIADAYKDATDIDASTSTNETYDINGDFYSSPSSAITTSAASNWTDSNGTAVFSSGSVTPAGDDAVKSVDTFTGDFEMEYTVDGLSPGRATYIGVYPISEDGTFNASSGSAGLTSMTNSVFLSYSNVSGATVTASHGGGTDSGGSNIFAVSSGGTSVVKLTRVGSTYKVFLDGALEHTYTHTSSVEMRMAGGSGMTTHHTRWDEFTWTEDATVANMTLVSNAFTAKAVPATGRIHVQVKEIDSSTVNTDLTAEISRDGGTTWTSATLTLVDTLADGTKAYQNNSVDISGQPSGTSMKYRIKTLNTKEIQVHGTVLQWST